MVVPNAAVAVGKGVRPTQGTRADQGICAWRYVHGDTAYHHRLLDIVALTTSLLALPNPAATTLFTPRGMPAVNPSAPKRASRFGRLQVRHRLCAMDGDHVTGKVVLAAEGTAAGLVVASVGLDAVGVVGLDMGLEVVRSCEG